MNRQWSFRAALWQSTNYAAVENDQSELQVKNSERTMKGKISLIVFIGLMMLSATNRLLAQGARVEVFLNDGQKITGELLSVRESTLVVSFADGEHFKEGTSQREDSFIVLKSNRIQKVFIEGKSYVDFGIGFGLVAGAGIGLVVGLANSSSTTGGGWDPFPDIGTGIGNVLRTAAYTIGGAGAGSIIGYVVGSQASSSDKEVAILSLQDMQTLKGYARFQR
ncbi:MAG: hypothetical protein ABSF91_06195 [Bacteroidota bacterium]